MLFFTLLPPSTQEKQAIAAHAKQKVGTHTLVHDGGAWPRPYLAPSRLARPSGMLARSPPLLNLLPCMVGTLLHRPCKPC
jgi:hypothetical protein